MDVEFVVEAVGFSGPEQVPTVMLHEREGHRYLHLAMGAAEMYAVAQVVQSIRGDRPSTHDMLAAMALALRLEPVSLRLQPWRGSVHRATFTGLQDGRVVSLDCRPSDGVALALRLGAPILGSPALVRRFAMREEYRQPDAGLVRLDDLDAATFGQWVM